MRAKTELAELTLSPIARFSFPFTNPPTASFPDLSRAMQPLFALYKSHQITPAQHEEADRLLDQIKKRRLYDFIIAVNAQLDSLNTLIDAYNHADTFEDKHRLLNDLIAKKNEIDANFPESAIKICPEYIHAFYETMTSEIQSQRQQLANHDIDSSSHRYGLSHLLQTMSPAKLNRMLQILYNREQYEDELEALYTETDEGYQEFNQFLQTHAISFIGGHNSSNLLIESKIPPLHSYVLKLENRLNQPQNIAQHFSQTVLKDIIPQPDIARRAWFTQRHRNGKEEVIVRTIMTQPYYAMGSVYQYAFTQPHPSQRIKSALNLYQQMGDILLKLSHNGGAFPDMKNSNWLIDDRLMLQIADDKSLRWQNPDGTLDVFSDNSQWHGDILKSPEYMPPEVFQATNPIVVDTLHVFTWGKDLYEYLTVTNKEFEADNGYLKIRNGADFNFEDFSIFSTIPTGPLLKQLIIDTVKPEPSERISMETALARLSQIHQLADLHQSLLEILFRTHFPPDIIQKYMQHAFSTTHSSALTDYIQEANRPALLNSVETFQHALRKQYDAEWLVLFKEIDSILEAHPNAELQAYYDQCLDEYKDLKPYNYEQFADDLSNLYEEAQNLKQCSTMPQKSHK